MKVSSLKRLALAAGLSLLTVAALGSQSFAGAAVQPRNRQSSQTCREEISRQVANSSIPAYARRQAVGRIHGMVNSTLSRSAIQIRFDNELSRYISNAVWRRSLASQAASAAIAARGTLACR